MKILEKLSQVNIEKNKAINKILSLNKKYRIDFLKTGKNKLLSIFEGDKMILSGDYHFYGIYQPETKLWVWASSIPGVETKQIKYIQKIKASSYLFDSDNNAKTNFYFQLLTQDVLLITNEEMLIWINELLLYLSDDISIFNPTNSDSNVQFISLINIKEKYT
jgi:hypothetical protein